MGGLKPPPEDVLALKQSALPEETELDTDRIACQVVAREIQKRKRRRAKK